MCVSNLGTLLCHPLQNNNVKWLSSTYFRERKPQWLIFRMSFWNWTLLVHLSQAQFFRPIFRDLTHYTTKTSPSKTIAVHTRYKSLYISLPSSAKQQREMTKFCVVWGTRTMRAKLSYFYLELNDAIAYLAWSRLRAISVLKNPDSCEFCSGEI